MRSILTMLGIVIGIASVIILMSIGQSAQNLILNQVKNIGSNVVFILPGATKGSKFSSPASTQGIIIKTLTKNDVNALQAEPSVIRVAPQVQNQGRIIYGNNDTTVTYVGTTGDFFPIRNFGIQKGVALTNRDNELLNHVVVLGSKISDVLFGNLNPIDKYIRLDGISFRVVGVLELKGLGPLGVDNDTLAFIPLSVAQKQLLGTDYYNVITVQANDVYNTGFVTSRITSVLRQDHHITNPDKDDFTIRTQEDALSLLGNVTSILTLFLAAIASISLVVGGIGIMNIMLVAVTERTREIGLRKAVGATNGDILKQFLIESVLLTIIGGTVGIAIGAGIVGLVYFVLSTFFSSIGWVFAFPISAVVLGLLVSGVAGIVFGIYPAYQAGKKNPIDALRYE